MVSRLKDTLLLVGGISSDRVQLREIFEGSYNLLEAENAFQAKLLLGQNLSCIAAVLADIPVSDNGEIRILTESCRMGTEQEVPLILFITPVGTGEREELAFALGATDVVYKPYTAAAVQRRLQIIVDLYLHKWHLETLVEEQSETIRNANQIMLDALSAIIEHRNTESGNHVLRIRRFIKILLEELARCCPEYDLTDTVIESIASASALHDIGKISIPDAILNKPGPLTDEEYEVMKTHTTVGGELIQNLQGIADMEYLRYAYNIALYHHERWDGRGYPCGLKGDDIPICAQVAGIADAFDALTTPRVYKPALSCDRAVNMILNGECGRFSSKLLECFKHVRIQFAELAHQYADGYSPKSDHIAVPLPGPVWQTEQLDTLQLSQVKYQALLHYINDTVIEFDLDNKIYHVVYNPNPDVEALIFNAPFEEVMTRLSAGIHPEDRAKSEADIFLTGEFFRQNLHKKTITCRIYSPAQAEYIPFEVTLLRVNTQNMDRRVTLVVFHRLAEYHASAEAPLSQYLYDSPALYGLVSSALRCRSDRAMTIDAGARDLYQLTGYTAEEIGQKFNNSYLELVLPQDRPALLETMEPLLRSGGKVEAEYRLMRKDGTSVWVLAKSRAYVESDGREYIYHAIRDNSHTKNVHERMLADAEYNRIVIDQSGIITFDWDIPSDTMTYSPKWAAHFGYIPVSVGYGAQLGIATHIHADDLPTMRERISLFQSGLDYTEMEIRIANAQGRYLWTKITAAALRSEDGTLVRVIGILQDIDEWKRTALVLKEQAERDALTKLLNKASTRQLAAEYLDERDEGAQAAMLVLDLDNFKSVNDTYGHLYGDTVLSQLGDRLKKLFRAHDIIGRIGGDEFLILMKDIPNEELLVKRCRILLDMSRELLSGLVPDLDVSCSIGAAVAPFHGTSYSELFRHADEALYITKSKGKNTYTIYDPRESFGTRLGGKPRVTTCIDSDEQPGLANGSFVRTVFRRLYESSSIEKTVEELLAYIGKQLNVSRVYIFENSEDNTACSNTFEWCNEGISPEIDSLQNLSYTEDIPGWHELFDERGTFYCSDINGLAPHFREILEPQGIRSMLQCAIMDGGVFRGYVGFDECTRNRMWNQEQINLLQFFSEVVTLFLLKQRTRDKAVEQARNLRSILDNQDSWIYVIDPDTFELKFLNEKTKILAPDVREGMTCYKAFMDRCSHCESCPSANIRRTGNASGIIENRKLGVRVRVMASHITWNGKESCLVICHDLSKEV